MSNPLDRLTIRGFKSIRALEDFELKDLNVFIGANGAGKSNLLEFFRLLRAIIDGRLIEYVRSRGGISDLLFNGRKTTSKMDFEMHFGPRGYRFSLRAGPLEDVLLTDEARYYYLHQNQEGWWTLGDSSDGKSLLVREAEAVYLSGNGAASTKPTIYHHHRRTGIGAASLCPCHPGRVDPERRQAHSNHCRDPVGCIGRSVQH